MERKLKTVAQVAKDSDGAWSESSLRWMIFNAESNGMKAARVIYRVGRRVRIDPAAFDKWIDSLNPQAGAA